MVRLWWLSFYALALLMQFQFLLCAYTFKRLVVVPSFPHIGYSDYISENKETFVFPLDTLSHPERVHVTLHKINELHVLLGTQYIYEQLNQRLKEESRIRFFVPKLFLFHSLGPSLFEFQNLLYSYCDKEPETIQEHKIKEINFDELFTSEFERLRNLQGQNPIFQTQKTFTLPSDPQSFSLETLRKNIRNFGLMLMLESMKHNQCKSVIQAKKLSKQMNPTLFDLVIDEFFIAFVQYHSRNVQNIIFKKDLENIELKQTYDTIVLPLEVLTQGNKQFSKLEKFALRYRERYLGTYFITDRFSQKNGRYDLPRLKTLGSYMIPCLHQISSARARLLQLNEGHWSIPNECKKGNEFAQTLLDLSNSVKTVVEGFFLKGDNPTRVQLFFAHTFALHFPWFIIFEWMLNLVKNDFYTLSVKELRTFHCHFLFPSYLTILTKGYEQYLMGMWRMPVKLKSQLINQKRLHTGSKPALTLKMASSNKDKVNTIQKNSNIQVQRNSSNTVLENPSEEAGTSSRKRKNSKDNASLSNPSKRFKSPFLVTLERKDSNSISNPQPSTSSAFPDPQTMTDAELLFLIENADTVPASEIALSTQTSSTDPAFDELISALDSLEAKSLKQPIVNGLELIQEFLNESKDNENI